VDFGSSQWETDSDTADAQTLAEMQQVPEQRPRHADLWQLGAILYCLATGRNVVECVVPPQGDRELQCIQFLEVGLTAELKARATTISESRRLTG